MKREVNDSMKVLYALAMVFVVAGHSCYGELNFLTNWFPFYGFHVGIFVFASGYLYQDSAEEDVKGFVLKKLKKMILPLYLWNLFYGILVLILSNFGFNIGQLPNLKTLIIDPVINGHQFGYNLGSWCIFSFFVIQILNLLVRKLIPAKGIKVEILLFVVCIACGILGNSIAIRGDWDMAFLPVIRVLHLLPFWGFGTFYKRVLEEHFRIRYLYYFAIIFGAQLILITYLQKVPYYTDSWCNNFVDGPIIPVIYGFIGVSFWYGVARILAPGIGKSRAVLAVANNTYSIMVNHFLGFMLLKGLFALVNHLTGMFGNFSWEAFKGDLWYVYYPRDNTYMGIIYLVFGLGLPILMQCGVDFVKEKLQLKNK